MRAKLQLRDTLLLSFVFPAFNFSYLITHVLFCHFKYMFWFYYNFYARAVEHSALLKTVYHSRESCSVFFFL